MLNKDDVKDFIEIKNKLERITKNSIIVSFS